MCSRHVYADIGEHTAGGKRSCLADDDTVVDRTVDPADVSGRSDEAPIGKQIVLLRRELERLGRCELAYERVFIDGDWLVEFVDDVDDGPSPPPATSEVFSDLLGETVVDLDARPSIGIDEESEQGLTVAETLRLAWDQQRLDEHSRRRGRVAVD